MGRVEAGTDAVVWNIRAQKCGWGRGPECLYIACSVGSLENLLHNCVTSKKKCVGILLGITSSRPENLLVRHHQSPKDARLSEFYCINLFYYLSV